jgi:hypothetical protein
MFRPPVRRLHVNFASSSFLECLHQNVSPKVQNNPEPRLRNKNSTEPREMLRYAGNSRQQHRESETERRM